METVTIKDIAKALNLSTSTVSRALRGSYEISEETKSIVKAYAEKVNYRPNPIALSLKENKSWSIGVIVPEIANNFFSNAINGIDEIAHEKGYHVTIYQNHESIEREKAAIEHVVTRKLDGLIMSLAGFTTDLSYIKKLQEDGFPIVFFDRIPQDLPSNTVVADNYQGAFDATEHLINKGRKRIAHITSPPILSITRERLAGYKAALQKHGITINENLIKYCEFDASEAFETIKQVMKDEKPDAIFTASDRLALNCYAAVSELNLKVPEDVAFIGFTNLKEAQLLSPPLTTVYQPAFEIGKKAGELLFQQIETLAKKRKWEFTNVKLSTELQIRQSSL